MSDMVTSPTRDERPFLERLVSFFEGEDAPLFPYIISFLSIVFLRNLSEIVFIENVFTKEKPDLQDFLHFSLFYLNVMLALYLFYIKLLPEKKPKVLIRVILSSFIIIAFVPIFDGISSFIFGYKITYCYLFHGNTPNVWGSYFTFLWAHPLVSPGLSAELFLVTLWSGIYVFYVKRSWLRAILASWLTYSIIFWLFGALPLWLHYLQGLAGWPFELSTELFIKVLVLLSMIFFVAVFSSCQPRIAAAIWQDIRLTRMLHYQGMIFLGMVLGHRYGGGFPVDMAGALNWALLAAAVFFGCLFALITNNIADVEIDRISNPDRPSVTGVISAREYRNLALFSLFFAAALSATVGAAYLCLVGSFVGIYSLYSLPPFRLKRLFLFSKGLIGLNCLLVALAGYALAGLEPRTVPLPWALLLLLGYSACINFIDLKDIEGDRAEGIKTLPVVVGEVWSKRLIALAFFFTYISFAVLAESYWMIPFSIVSSLWIAWALMKKEYREQRVFFAYLVTSSVMVLWLIVKDIELLQW